MGKSRLNEVRACPIFFADTKEAISNFILRQPLLYLEFIIRNFQENVIYFWVTLVR